ncbi:hypothetical protein [Alysiella crassa]|uniref:Uncharacterized protein n=1 Tax=Alysiella crassa TaxID=153491 RepID=A0A376BMB7_9NEIS|nr:hypothetical protein [Alysiella crassa]UOP07443.1 hypothetical protein LVJ80_03235 [Alysiella crassa]SSY70364.1 Uncharacterised protein [Alysiella crassa]
MSDAKVQFYLKCQDLNTEEIKTYVFDNDKVLLEFAQKALQNKLAILKHEIRFHNIHKWYGRRAHDPEALTFTADDYENALDGAHYLKQNP